MPRKLLVVGGVAGGASAAARLRRLSEEDQIIVFEKGPHVSFSNCCLPYHLSGTIEKAEDLVLMTPELFKSQYNIDVRTDNEVVSIDRQAKEVVVKKLTTGEEYRESYDKLVLSPGGKPIVPPIPGIEKVKSYTIRNVVDIAKLAEAVKGENVKNVSVIGGGFIGIETVENLKEAGYNVTLVEAMPQILRILDSDMVQILHKELYDQGVNLIVNDKVSAFEENKIILGSGRKVDADVVVLAIGVSPEIDLAKGAGLEIGKTGAIKVDQNYRTVDRDIYAVGDAIEVYSYLFNDYFKLPLAGPAQKQARGVADHINGMKIDNRGYIGSSILKVFDYNAASTGMTVDFIRNFKHNIDFDCVRVIPGDKVGLMPTAKNLHFKLVYEVPTGKILGAQAIGKGNVDKRIDVIATVIKFGGTIRDLQDLELCYAPPFGTAKDVVNFAGYVATNRLHDVFKQVNVDDVRDLVEHSAAIFDVREENEYELSHIKGAKNIPLSQLRDRINEFPKDRNIYLHCRSGQRSYNAVLALQNLGFKRVYNVSGGFMGVSFHEFFHDKMSGRDTILTDYNFD
ncbi:MULTISPECIES: FAD-dependent oxidoreductase [unclassified Oceanispirochaeta]|uniref:FAD-dependent oxidoreductase n=1 Tax=unclassified Oceanispirochaeta TaxID=2635722 RepID=UPI000E08E4FF|nr:MULTISPECIES: FAD-dependent oxidoreductase [unclassified Oceanispirochaeta]MBF9016003.1 FAD-dependent oxidoreductase [Oceanispirochaeta sp. M2]NPD72466.1 FAD-dependent oxidoreductase [Oceanispirochaeta sp. M1]RDG31925.1 pyridine nucleotide-disulfide oxidoreductase [Oceanispirochaeta sp. M1]